MEKWTERKAADREKMAAYLETFLREAGATVSREDPLGARSVRLKVSVTGGAYISVNFDGDSCQRDIFVCTWNTECDSVFAFSGYMGEVNPFHFAKATRICYGFPELCDTLRDDVETLLSGKGYCAERAAIKAAERKERHARSREYLAPLVAAGKGTEWSSGLEHESPQLVRDIYERLPDLMASLDSFMAAGCPMADAGRHPWK